MSKLYSKFRMHHLKVIYEDNHLIAVNKPVGVLVHADETGDATLMDQVKLYIKWKYEKPGDVFLGSFHRLDRPASGVVVFARTSKALVRMNKLMHDREVKKSYYAITEERPDEIEDHLIHYLIKDKYKNFARAHNSKRTGTRRAELKYRLASYIEKLSLLDIDLITGRPHQIRVQLSKIDCPVFADRKYGGQQTMKHRCIALHAYKMEFIHPVKKEPVSIQAEMPDFHPWTLFFDLGE